MRPWGKKCKRMNACPGLLLSLVWDVWVNVTVVKNPGYGGKFTKSQILALPRFRVFLELRRIHSLN